MDDLRGRAAIVTGGAKGIGAGIVDVLGDLGVRVVVADIDEAGAAVAAQRVVDRGGEAVGASHDVTQASSCRELVERATDAFGPVDLLVNNAGVSQRVAFTAMDERSWDRVIDVNLKGVYLMTQAVVGQMLEGQAGAIVNIASILGKSGFDPLFSHYTASKFGVVGLTQALAVEFAPSCVRVNAVSPGVVLTPMQEEGLREEAAERGITLDEVWKQVVALVPLRRPQLPEDIGRAVAFLASDWARNITGETLNVNGGQLLD